LSFAPGEAQPQACPERSRRVEASLRQPCCPFAPSLQSLVIPTTSRLVIPTLSEVEGEESAFLRTIEAGPMPLRHRGRAALQRRV